MVGLNELSEEIARKLLTSPREVKKIISIFLDEIVNEVKKGEMVKIAGFGTFRLKLLKRRKIWDLNNRKFVELPERRKLVFHPSKKVKLR